MSICCGCDRAGPSPMAASGKCNDFSISEFNPTSSLAGLWKRSPLMSASHLDFHEHSLPLSLSWRSTGHETPPQLAMEADALFPGNRTGRRESHSPGCSFRQWIKPVTSGAETPPFDAGLQPYSNQGRRREPSQHEVAPLALRRLPQGRLHE